MGSQILSDIDLGVPQQLEHTTRSDSVLQGFVAYTPRYATAIIDLDDLNGDGALESI